MMQPRAVGQAAIDREWVRRRGLPELAKRAWGIVEPSARLRWSWSMDAICEHLTALARREIRDLVINVPPGCSKSLLSSVLFPAWVWTFDPGHRFIFACYSDRIAVRDAEKQRTLVKSDWYRERWPHVVIPTGKAQSDAVLTFKTSAGGFRYSTTCPDGQLTGEHCDTFGVDDPSNPRAADATSGQKLDAILDWWRGTVPTRFRDHTSSARFCIMQRLHMRDLAAEMIREGATVLCLPMEYESRHPHRWARDPRTTDGELLVPERVPATELPRIKRVMGSTRTAAQLQQRPVQEGGKVFKKEWFQLWTELPPGGTWALSVDCAFKDTDDSSFVVIQVWYQHGANFYLVDQHREQMGFSATVRAIIAMSARYPFAFLKLIEAKANGPAVVNVLEEKLPGLELVEPEGGKETRANAVQPLVESHNVYVPHPQNARYDDGRVGAPWVEDYGEGDPTEGGFLGEVTTFPNAATDDATDAMTQFLNHAAPGIAERLEAAMEAVFKKTG